MSGQEKAASVASGVLTPAYTPAYLGVITPEREERPMKSALNTFQSIARIASNHAPFQPDPDLPLWQIAWEDERTDLPGIAGTSHMGIPGGDVKVEVACHCGQRFSAVSPSLIAAEDAAMADLIAHAHRALVATA